MDIKLKNKKQNKKIGVIVGFILLLAIAILIVELYTPIYKNAQKILDKWNATNIMNQERNSFENEEFLEMIYKSNFALLFSLRQKEDSTLSPSSIFLPYYSIKVQNKKTISSAESLYAMNFDQFILDCQQEFSSRTLIDYPTLTYYILDNKSGKVLTNTDKNLPSLRYDTVNTNTLESEFSTFISLQTIDNKYLSVSNYKGIRSSDINRLLWLQRNNSILNDIRDYYYEVTDDDQYQYYDSIQIPSDITIIYALEYPDLVVDDIESLTYLLEDSTETPKFIFNHTINSAFYNAGFKYICFSAILLITFLGLTLPFIKAWGIGRGFAARVPFEFMFIASILTIPLLQQLASLGWNTINSDFVFEPDFSILSKPVQHVFLYTTNVTLWMIVLWIWYVFALSARQLFIVGPLRFIKENTLFGLCICFLFRTLRKSIHSFKNIDFTAKTNRILMKILGINFCALALISCTWFYGIILLVPYTIFLFYLSRRYITNIKNQYSLLLEGTSKIANGNLNLSINEPLGVFEPLKEELSKIQQGFSKAVIEETKSERMKTELITNVSHDLKTPLTAIITYIELLKGEQLTKEEQKNYIDTLDMKSQRLKRLIEDLFEVSKASSENISLNIMDVDLVHLIKQVLLELDDKIQATNIEFRCNFPPDKIIVALDSDRTYRIFENLIINITKYAMMNTRAYIDLVLNGEEVIVTLKNISASELNYNADELSERFVRGDLSRNTEGSGLGLAIAKSFVELQDGKFMITSDGDLFKVIIKWTLNIKNEDVLFEPIE